MRFEIWTLPETRYFSDNSTWQVPSIRIGVVDADEDDHVMAALDKTYPCMRENWLLDTERRTYMGQPLEVRRAADEQPA